jgi:hypothetical protein
MKNSVESAMIKFPKAKQRAVSNFAGTVSAEDKKTDTLLNLSMDARSYGWNTDTVKAIKFCLWG